MADIPVIYILSRNNYNNFGDENYGNNIFFVRENSENLDDTISLYVGKAKQSDVVIVNGQSVWDNATNTVNVGTGGVPVDYKVEGKLILAQRKINDKMFYNALTYNSSANAFIDCGIPNNVVLVDENWSTSDTLNAVKDFFYIQPSTHSIYVFNGHSFDSVITSTMFITRDEAESRFVTTDKLPTVDGVTLKARSVTSQETTHSEFYGPINMQTGQINLEDENGVAISGNVTSGTDVPLATVVNSDSTTSGYCQLYNLPRNGGELRISNAIGDSTHGAVSIIDISMMDKSDGTVVERSDDYLSVMIFKKSSSVTDASSVMSNFSETGSNKIYLMNPDIDISQYTVIHLMLYYDGFNMCAIVTGYNDES